MIAGLAQRYIVSLTFRSSFSPFFPVKMCVSFQNMWSKGQFECWRGRLSWFTNVNACIIRMDKKVQGNI